LQIALEKYETTAHLLGLSTWSGTSLYSFS